PDSREDPHGEAGRVGQRCRDWRLSSRTELKPKGGEALPETAVEPVESEPFSCASPGWHVLWTHSHCEQLVHDQLAPKGFKLFLPTIDAWSRRFGIRRLSRAPLFGGYLFLHHAMDKVSYVEVRKARGLVRVLGERWDRLDVVPDHSIERSEEHTSELQSPDHLVCRLLLEK